jgi:flagellar biosynthesis chaperone FliJ
MANLRYKTQKIQPLIKLRRMQLDQESMLLNQIQLKKYAAKQALASSQTMYMDGVEKLNKERQSPERKMLETLELGVDYAKAQWYQNLMQLRSLEDEEKKQRHEVEEAQRRMKMLEKLEERYHDQYTEQQKIIEQKQIDDFALQMARRKNLD